MPTFPLRDPDRARAGGPTTAGAIPISGGTDPLMGALQARPVVAGTARDAGAARDPDPTGAVAIPTESTRRSPMTTAVLTAIPERAEGSLPPDGDQSGHDVSGHAAASGPCAELRRVADERCELATRARAQAAAAEDELRRAQRAYDDHEARAAAAQAAADPRAIRAAKDAAQQRFRQARAGAATTEDVEIAARAWLSEVNAINNGARDAAALLARERAAAQALGASLERRVMETDGARISAEAAEAACLEAREAVAACDEASATAGAVPHLTSPTHTPGAPFPIDDADAEADPLAAALAGGSGTPRIFRLVRGDRAAMTELVGALAGDDAEERRRWQLAVANLVDAIIADAIEGATLEFPHEHPFWGPFTVEQDRDVVRALASLGYRFDGLGGWVDGRIPSQRDLSLALGYAGLDPMRIRHWPTESEMTDLFADVTVAADEHLAGAAGDLTLGELVSMLGRRADALAELWNQWGLIRPLLLEDA